MCNERKKPIVCLKINVKACLLKGERAPLYLAPKKDGDKILIPSEALKLAGIDASGDYVDYEDITALCKSKNEMGLIFLSDAEVDVDLSISKDLKYMLTLANSFIFDIPLVKLGSTYAPATPEEVEGFKKVGSYALSLLKARNNTHPFLFANQSVFDKIKEIYNSKDGSLEYKNIVSLVERAYSLVKQHFPALNDDGTGFKTPFPESGFGEDEYDVGGRHSNSECYLDHVQHIAFAHLVTGDDDLAKIAYFSALALIGRKHWGPGHFLNCSGAAGYLSTSYDWLYNSWKRLGLDTGVIKKGIYSQGILHGYNSVVLDSCIFPSPKQGTGWRFKLKNDNWNAVCNSGLVISSLCILNEGTDDVITKEMYDNTRILIGANLTSLMQDGLVYKQYAPDGSYIESNSYWAYGTNNLIRAMGALHSALGTDLGMHNGCGLDKTCYYALNSESADFVGWNYHDGSLSKQDTSLFNMFATVSGDHMLYSLRDLHLARGKSVSIPDVIYSPRILGIDKPVLKNLPLDYAMIGIDAFVVRNGWESGSLYAGMMGGENPAGGSHNQLDSGSFVYHNYGKLWFTDMGSDYYNIPKNARGETYFSNYGLYKRNAEGNNTLALKSLPYGQLLGKNGPMIEYKSSDSASYCIIDNLEVYGSDKVTEAKRGMLLTNNRETLIIKDSVKFTNKDTAFWIAHFESDKITAKISEDGKSCAMTYNDGTSLNVSLLSKNGKFEVMSCYDFLLDGTESAEGEHSRENHRRLVIKLENTKEVDLCIAIGNVADAKDIPMEMWKTL